MATCYGSARGDVKRLRAVLSGSCSSLNMHDPRWPDGATRLQSGGFGAVGCDDNVSNDG